MQSLPTPAGYGHGHRQAVLLTRHEREEVRGHLVAAHAWPAVARYDATADELDELHRLYHDPDRIEEALIRTRWILGMPDELPDDLS